MSDFIYTSVSKPYGELAGYIKSIYHGVTPKVSEFHGGWGALAVSHNHYVGFQSVETDDHIMVIIGGPVLMFTDSSSFLHKGSNIYAMAVYDRWRRGAMIWEDDLSGPYAILVIDKIKRILHCITDLMLFIPVYKYDNNGSLVLGTHIDATAKAAGQRGRFDKVSLVDFILNDFITYPYTAFEEIRQCKPASVHVFSMKNGKCSEKTTTYWVPSEDNHFQTIDDASLEVRNGIYEYIGRITGDLSRVAQFISGGEDSRAVCGFLPKTIQRDAFIFLDYMNREGQIAKRVADAYGLDFNLVCRNPTYYLDILPQAADLVGTGHQYLHAHSIGLSRKCRLPEYPAVFGGYLSDTLLKGYNSRKTDLHRKYSFLYEYFIPEEVQSRRIKSSVFQSNLLESMNDRRVRYMHLIKAIRPVTCHEWFLLWPATMHASIPNFLSTRRLFSSYEPFMCNKVIKVSAAVPIEWKMNRRLFHKAMKPMLRDSWWIPHSDGRFPYFPWWINCLSGFLTWFSRGIFQKISEEAVNHGPWSSWKTLVATDEWKEVVWNYTSCTDFLKNLTKKDITDLTNNEQFSVKQKLNILQILYAVQKEGKLSSNQDVARI